MRSIFALFGRSPFPPLASHMETVACCVLQIRSLFKALSKGEKEEMAKISKEISKLEHIADLSKVDIRKKLPKSIYLPVDRAKFLETLTLQDSLADTAEDIARILSLKDLALEPFFAKEFHPFLEKNLEAFETARKIVQEWHDVLESSFSKIEVERVESLVEKVAHQEHEADLLQNELLKKFYGSSEKLSYEAFFLWQKVFERISAISNLAENLANQVQLMMQWR